MTVNEIINLAKSNNKKTENVIARGVIIEFLLSDDENKLFRSEICKIFNCTRQNISNIVSSFDSKYCIFGFYKQCKKIIEQNKEIIRKNFN
jgi:hypothetical protein